MNNRDKLRLFENILAKVGIDGDVLGEYSKALSLKNGFDTYTSMQNLQNLPANPPMSGQTTQTPPQMGVGIPQETMPPEMPL